MNLKEYIKENENLKKILYRIIMHPIKTRPNWWIRMFSFMYTQKGKNSVIYKSVRFDITPFRSFIIGNYSVIEDFSCVNNAVGDIIIGSNTRIGLHNTVIGPVTIGDNVNIAQGVVISGLNHSFDNSNKRIDEQKVKTQEIKIGNDVWVGANSVILSGITIGNHCVIGAGSIVTKDIPGNSLAVGNPARIIKKI